LKGDKNSLLKRARNISFEQVVLAIEDNRVADVMEHPNQEKNKWFWRRVSLKMTFGLDA